ncbi:MAG: PEP-CTERM sorting domain-containing protein [Luteolibacter sp.]|uniref:PEP-CTERM sorting domain-containing protein n=1 Tax=Luteolibacter sp. TaxID=1962973 RepID=UPI003266D920
MLHPLAGFAVSALTVMSAHAATVVFGPATTFSSASVLDTPYAAGYTFVSAMNVGDAAKTFNTPGGTSITFAAGTGSADLGNVNMPGTASSTTGYYNGDAQWNAGIFAGGTGITAFDDVLRGNAWHTNTSDSVQPLTLRLTGLTIGETYAVYLYSVDVRAGSAGRAQAYWDGFSSPNFTGNTSGSFSQNSATVVNGSFTANAAFQDVFIQETDGVGNDDTHLSAFILYQVPEPTSALLMSGACLLFGFSRRRA